MPNFVEIGRDLAIFRFFKMAAAAILDFQTFKFSTVGGFKSVELRRHDKFGRNQWNRYRDMEIFHGICKFLKL